MQYLVLVSRDLDNHANDDFTPRLEAEAKAARGLYQQGFIRQIWLRDDKPGACLILEADNETAARDGLNALPLLAAGMLRIDVLTRLLPYRGFA